MINRAMLKEQSKNQLKGRWVITGGLYLLMMVVLIIIECIPTIGWIGTILIVPPCVLTYAIIALKASRMEQLNIDDTWSGFLNYGKAIGLYFWTILWTWLWALLLIIPGIIKGLSYSMAFYILADNPNMGIREAFNESKRITYGHKWDLFVLGLSFMGWVILAVLTFGIGYFWLIPYMQTTYANTYKSLAGKEY
ncbi:MAG: DUF975 family protein [Cellulosilyticaceae bacterium]